MKKNLDSKNNLKEFQNVQIKVELENQGNLDKNRKELIGQIIIKPKYILENFPVHVQIQGKSCCDIVEGQVQYRFTNQQKVNQKQFNAEITEAALNQEIEGDQRFFSSFQYLNEVNKQDKFENQSFRESSLFITEDFLEGKQSLYQINQKNGKRLDCLIAGIQYKYPFSFMLPNSLPISINEEIFSGINLFVEYSILIHMNIKQFESEENELIIKNKKDSQQIKIKRIFKIKRFKQNYPYEMLTNNMSFKYYHPFGQAKQFYNQDCCKKLLRCFLFSFNFQQDKGSFDLYHSEMKVTINQNNLVHLVLRIYLQPDKQNLDERKIKKGDIYHSSPKKTSKSLKSGSPEQHKQQSPEKRNEKQIKITNMNVKMFGQLVGIKKILIFQKRINLSSQNYDMVEGEIIFELEKQYFSQKNQLFELKYWFQIEAIDLNNQVSTRNYVDMSKITDKQSQQQIDLNSLNSKDETVIIENNKSKHKKNQNSKIVIENSICYNLTF